MRKDDLAYIGHIVLCIRKIKKYMKGLTKAQFKENELVQDAVIRNIEIIGEASKSISAEFRKDYSNIPWKEISGMRDKLIIIIWVLTLMLFGQQLSMTFLR